MNAAAHGGKLPPPPGADGAARPYWRPLKALLGGQIDVPESIEISDLTLDSRAVQPGAAFLACRGQARHGIEFVPQAVAAGARAVLWEPGQGIDAPRVPDGVLAVAVPGLGRLAGLIADRYFEAPSAALDVTGITGTNGKTTCTWLLASALGALGRSCAYMGTLGAGLPGDVRPGTHTTPDAVTVHRRLAELRALGAQAVAMEVSSHALDQHRCAGVRFRRAAFTNLTRDHLDYHPDMAHYGAAKAALFAWPSLDARIVNIDDAFGRELAARHAQDPGLVETTRNAAAADGAMGAAGRRLRAVRTMPEARGLCLEVDGSWGAARLRAELLGEFNADNLLTVLALLLAMGVPLDRACGTLSECRAPPGRMQLAGGSGLPLAIVDYAHTPDALDKALRAVRTHCGGRVLCVFGCGGDRDRGKRPEMARVAEALADAVYLTDDNPRGEDPRRIVADIVAGLAHPDRAVVEHDRANCIAAALAAAAPGDAVLVAGKGHEDYQVCGGVRRPFSDLAQVRAALGRRGGA